MWVRSAVPHIPKADAPPTGALPFELRKKLNVRTLPRRGDPGATSAPLKKRQEGSQDSEAGQARPIGRTRPLTIGSSTLPHLSTVLNLPSCTSSSRPSSDRFAQLWRVSPSDSSAC